MQKLIITEKPELWSAEIADAEIINPATYINSDNYKKYRAVKIINLCESYQYQSEGYYISLLAEARGHKVIPVTSTLMDFKLPKLAREDAEDFDTLIQETLDKATKAEEIDFLIYFGTTGEPMLNKIGQLLFNLFQMPIQKVSFVKKGKWQLVSLKPLNLKELNDGQREQLNVALQSFMNGKKVVTKTYKRKKYDLAILVNPSDPNPPSDAKAIQRFVKAAEQVGFNVELITKADYGRITQFDALFIRETTNVNHHTFRFARKAEYEGLVVIDDPESILKCTNKVYLDELLRANKVPTPFSVSFGKKERHKLSSFSYPYVIKQPDGAFSLGVKKVNSKEEEDQLLKTFFQKTDLLIAQEFMPSSFDWRIGVLAGKVIYVCKYYMARNHWQIINWRANEGNRQGNSEALEIDKVPKRLLSIAVKASSLIGNGLYGVDIKEVNGKYYVIEVNDNPSIDSGVEDKVVGKTLYEEIMKHMMNRILD